MSLLKNLRNPNTLIWRFHPHEADQPILRATRLSARYENHAALEEVSFELQQGERLAVVGPNGAGKSTLFKIIAGVQNPSSGQVHIFGHEPGGHICIAYLPQRSQVDMSFPVSVADVVMMGRIGKLGLLRWPKPKDWAFVRHALNTVGMAHLADRQINELSGGQQQRMFIARALAQEAELMLMDEPLTGLDANSVNDIFAILDTLQAQNVTVMVALHDLKMAAEQFDRVMLLNHRLVGLGHPKEVFLPEKLVEAYGGHLQLVPAGESMLALGDTCCDEGEHNHA